MLVCSGLLEIRTNDADIEKTRSRSARSSNELLFSLDVEDVGLIEVFKLEKIDLVL
ncbi:4639_t:CDS:2, partial [Cetraspora pellucida]